MAEDAVVVAGSEVGHLTQALHGGRHKPIPIHYLRADARAMALCAMAEALYRGAGSQGIASTSIGGVRVQYREDGKLWQKMYRCAGIYLDIYRGKELGKSRGVSAV